MWLVCSVRLHRPQATGGGGTRPVTAAYPGVGVAGRNASVSMPQFETGGVVPNGEAREALAVAPAVILRLCSGPA